MEKKRKLELQNSVRKKNKTLKHLRNGMLFLKNMFQIPNGISNNCVENHLDKYHFQDRFIKTATRNCSFSQSEIQKCNQLFLSEVCLGLESSYNDIFKDPAFSTNRNDLNLKMEVMKTRIKSKEIHKTRDNNKKLQISKCIQTLFESSFEIDQHKMLAMLSFDYKNAQIAMVPCKKCNCMIMTSGNNNPAKLLCMGCSKLKKNQNINFLIEKNYLPVWKMNEKWQFELPSQLCNLTLGEKLCIQKYQGKKNVQNSYRCLNVS